MRNVEIQVNDHSAAILEALNQNVDKTLEMLGLQAAGYAALNLENDPRRIDTGLLRNSIAYAIAGQTPVVQKTHGQDYQNNGHDKNGNPVPIERGEYQGKIAKAEGEHSVYVGTNVEYGIYVHEGVTRANGSHMAANRFLRNAVNDHKEEYKRMIEQGLKGEL